MKILIITPSYKPAYVYGGPIFSVAYLAENLSKHQHEVLVLSTTANGKKELDVQSNTIVPIDEVNVMFFNRQTKDHSHLSLALLKFLWKNGNKYDVIHIQSWWNLVALLSAAICYIKNWRYVVSPRGMLSPYTFKQSPIKRLLHFFFGNVLLKKSVIHATSTDELQKISRLNPKYRIEVAPNFVDLSFEDSLVTKQDVEPNTILFLSRIHEKKGLGLLLESLREINIPIHLKIVGDGEEEYINKLKQQSLNLPSIHKVSWLGAKYDDEKIALYKSSSIYILPSQDENFANTVLESLSLGTAVLISKNVGLADFVSQNDLGWVYDGSKKQLISCILNALQNTDKLKAIRETAPIIIKSNFSTTTILNCYLQIYKWVKN